ncbi:MAG TPA: hypothetical protein VMA73_21700 [Streptosporangiaceae bacterium]|nr:hypothetical protein [Streptosporangiaceae bacterium]
MHDNDLRELFDRWAQPMRDAAPPAVSVIIKRKRRRTGRIAGTGVTSLAAVAVVAGLVGTSLSAGPRPTPQVRTTHATAPPYYLAVIDSGRSVGVWDSVTGQRVGSVHAPVETSVAGHRYHTVFTVLAAGSGRTFVLDATVNNNTTIEMPSGLFELELAADGSPGPLKPLTVVRVHQGRVGRWITSINSVALTADGNDLAVATSTYDGEISGPSKIEVVTLATGSTRTWTAGRQTTDFSSLSWAGDSKLAFTCYDPGSAVCVLNTTGRGGHIDTSDPLIPTSLTYHGLSTPISPVITPNGSDIYAELQGRSSIGLVEFSARTGRPLGIVISAPPSYNGFCGVLWSDPSGQHLTAACTWGSVTGTISHGVFTRGRNLPPTPTRVLQNGSGTTLIAW